MSYILDSLKKSDQERKRGSVPGLLSDHGESGSHPSQVRRRRWPYLLGGGLLLLNVAALVLWTQPWQAVEKVTDIPVSAAAPVDREEIVAGLAPGSGARAEQEAGAAASTGPLAAAAELTPSPARVVAAEDGNESARSRRDAEPQNGDTRGGPAAAGGDSGTAGMTSADIGREGRLPDPTEGEVSVEPGTGEYEVTAPADARQAPPAAELPYAGGPGEAALAAAEAVSAESAPEAGPSEGAGAEAVLPEQAPASRQEAGQGGLTAAAPPEAPAEVGHLPASVRKGLPEIHISAHFFSKNPASRLVSVNGRILREGQEMKNGLKVEEITPGGAIFNYQGKKFLMDIF